MVFAIELETCLDVAAELLLQNIIEPKHSIQGKVIDSLQNSQTKS